MRIPSQSFGSPSWWVLLAALALAFMIPAPLGIAARAQPTDRALETPRSTRSETRSTAASSAPRATSPCGTG